MARKTLKQMAEEAALEREEQYQSRLMAVLELATKKFNYELKVVNSVFALKNRDRYPRDPVLYFTLTPTPDSQMALEALEWELENLAKKEAEQERWGI